MSASERIASRIVSYRNIRRIYETSDFNPRLKREGVMNDDSSELTE